MQKGNGSTTTTQTIFLAHALERGLPRITTALRRHGAGEPATA
jgi:hypothetical protein